MRKQYYKGTHQLSLGEQFDMANARALAVAAGYEGGPGVGVGNGNLSALVRAVLGLPVEAGPEVKALIEKWKGEVWGSVEPEAFPFTDPPDIDPELGW